MTRPTSTARARRGRDDRGVALITTLLIMMLTMALLAGFATVVVFDQRYRSIDRDHHQAFYGATGGLEKLTTDLGNLFLTSVAPTQGELATLVDTSHLPLLTGVAYAASSAPTPLPASELSSLHCYTTTTPAVTRTVATVGANGYTISYCANGSGNPTTTADPTTITQGTYAGLIALKTPYQLDVTAKTSGGGEAHLVRTIEAVSIPVFQFGMFSDVDLAFNAADDFSFGGRVHTNGNLFLSQGANSTLTLSDRVTAVKEVVRQVLSNGNSIDNNSDTGTVKMAKGGGAYTNMDRTWGSVVAGPTSARNDPTWTAVSLSTYKGYIENGRTGAKQLNLPLITIGGTNTDLVRRPLATESLTSLLYGERMFGKTSLRILLSDTAADITNIPGIDTSVAPVSLEADNTASYGGVPIALSPGAQTTDYVTGTTASGSTAGGTTVGTIKVTALPSAYVMAGSAGAAALNVVSGSYQWTISGCTTKTANVLAGCTVTQTAGGSNVQVPVGATASAAGLTVTTTVTGSAVSTGSSKTVTLASTAGFSMLTNFWIDDNVASCTGYDTTGPMFTNCTTIATPSSGRTITTFAMVPKNTSVIGGYIKIERQNASDSSWHDVTAEILGYGIGAPSQSGSCDTSTYDPSPNAIVRLERLRDLGQKNATTSNCAVPAGMSKYDYWPNALFDTREGYQRETGPSGTNIKIGGVMYYVALDAANLGEWFKGLGAYAAGTGTQVKTDNGGYSVYFSDRRGNRDATNKETAEYGWEDFVNPSSSTAAPNGTLDAGEDVNANGVLDTYGGTPSCNGTRGVLANGGVTCALAPTAVVPTTGPNFLSLKPTDDFVSSGETTYNGVGRAMVNRALYFRRALKLVHGATIGSIVSGLTIVTENPAYIQGDWNASGGFNDPHAATSIIADAVTLLSNNWLDPRSFASPWSPTNRPRTANSYYRIAVLAGKGPIFPMPSGTSATFGTDGGAHSFLRLLEDNGSSPDTIHYRGSLATFYYNRQAVGVFKGVGDFVYGIPAVRDYGFDQDFLNPSLLPPLTPMFRDMNAVGFSQQLQPGK